MKVRIGEFQATADYFRKIFEERAYAESAGPRAPSRLDGAWRGLGKVLRALDLAGADDADERIVLACAKTARDLAEMEETGDLAKSIELRINIASSPIDHWMRSIREMPEKALRELRDGFLEMRRAPWGPVAMKMALSLTPALEGEILKNNPKRAAAGLLEQKFKQSQNGEAPRLERTISIGTATGREDAQDKLSSFGKEMSKRFGPERTAQIIMLHEFGHALFNEEKLLRKNWSHGAAMLAGADSFDEKEKAAIQDMGDKLLGSGIKNAALRGKIEKVAGNVVGGCGWSDAMRMSALWEECMADSLAVMLSRNLSREHPGEYPGFEETIESLRASREAHGKEANKKMLSVDDHGTEQALDELKVLAAKLPEDRSWTVDEMMGAAEVASARAVARAILATEKFGVIGCDEFMAAQAALAKIYGRNGEILAREEAGQNTLENFQSGLRKIAGAEWVKKLDEAVPPKVDLSGPEEEMKTFGRIGAAFGAAMSTPPGIPWKWRLGEDYALEAPALGLSGFRARREGLKGPSPTPAAASPGFSH